MNPKHTIPATLEAVSKFTQDLEIHFASISIEARTLITLAIQEILVNIVQHAYADSSGEIDFDMTLSQQELQISIRDYADNAFDMPDQISEPDPLALQEHGMGMFIIFQSFDNVQYERLSDGNRWQLIKKLG